MGGEEVKFSWQAHGNVRLRRLVEVNVALLLGLVCRAVALKAGIAKLPGRAA